MRTRIAAYIVSFAFVILSIINVTSAGTVVFDDGSQLMVSPFGPLPTRGAATVEYTNCNWIGYCSNAFIRIVMPDGTTRTWWATR